MYIKNLKVFSGDRMIRDVVFHMGVNLIVDEGGDGDEYSGNNVGKTTALRLIDVCLGGDAEALYADSESSQRTYKLVEDALKKERYKAEITLVDSLDNPQKTLVLAREFAVNSSDESFFVDGLPVLKSKFSSVLRERIFPGIVDSQPGFRGLISHNVRCDENRLSSVYRTLDEHTSWIEYSVLYSALFGIWSDLSSLGRRISRSLNKEKANQRYLEAQIKEKTLMKDYQSVCARYEELKKKKDSIFINTSVTFDIQKLSKIELRIKELNQYIASLRLKIQVIEKARKAVKTEEFNEDVALLKQIYAQAGVALPKLHADFEKLVNFHNDMLKNNADFIARDLPKTQELLQQQLTQLDRLKTQERNLKKIISNSASMEEFSLLDNSLQELSERKGMLWGRLKQARDAREKIKELELRHKEIQKRAEETGELELFRKRVEIFNALFSAYTKHLVGSTSLFTVGRAKDKNGVEYYSFDLQSSNHSTGNKSSETFCFDLAYTIFAESVGIPCLRFFLHDRKEVVDDKQLIEMARMAKSHKTQLVLSILRNRLPDELDKEEYKVLKLSQQDKLFKLP